MSKRKATASMSDEEVNIESASLNGHHNVDELRNNEKKRLKTRSLYRQPTVNELNRLHETENLFNSNLFRLQVEEVLQEVKVKEKLAIKTQAWCDKIKEYLKTIDEDSVEYDLSSKELPKKLKVKIPFFKSQLKRSTCNFQFHKFDSVEIVGSFVLDCAVSSKLCIDIVVVTPSATYTKNDSVNYKYHKKRAAYLACIASHLKNSDLIDDLKYKWESGSKFKPSLMLTPKGKLSKFIHARITLTCEKDTFQLHRYSPLRNNIRESWLDDNAKVGIDAPTPYYNSSVLYDITAMTNYAYLAETLINNDNVKHAIILLKIWLRQRNLEVSGFILSMFVASLLETKRINNVMSSYQIMRNVWISLKTSEWDSKGYTIYKGDNAPLIEDFIKNFPVVFIDTTGYYNICWQMDLGTYCSLKRESSFAVEMLDNPELNSFTPLFMTPFEQILQFDHILRLTNIDSIKDIVFDNTDIKTKLNFGIDAPALIVNRVCEILQKGLGDKVELIQPVIKADFTWDIKEQIEKASADYIEQIDFGFILNEESALNPIVKGPAANLPESERFREFWGEKSELRRFQDGSITETCVWQGATLAEKRLIVKEIVTYLLRLKLGIDNDYFYIVDQLDSAITCKQFSPPDGAVGTGEETSVKVLQVFDELRRELRALTDLPLDIHSVYGVSPVFSYADPFPPFAKGIFATGLKHIDHCILIKESGGTNIKCPPYTPVCHAIMELGHSGKWPGDIQAFRCLKAAFHLQIAKQIAKQYSIPAQANPKHIDVFKSGLAFRLEISHPKEINLMKRHLENGVVKHKESEESDGLYCRSILMPRLRGAMHGLHQEHPSYGPTVALTKRWLSSHLIDKWHFPDTVIELLAAYVFLRPEPYTAPNQPLTGFMRVLKLLYKTNWNDEVLILNFNNELSREEVIELEQKFTPRDDTMPALCVASSYDGDAPSIWSRKVPTSNILARVQILAKTTFEYLKESFFAVQRDNVLGALIPSLNGYDVTIHLHPQHIPHISERVERRPSLKKVVPPDNNCRSIPVLEFNPAELYLSELRSAYSDFALFFYDTYGGDIIAVLWKSNIKEKKNFEIVNTSGLKPLKKQEGVFKVNIAALIEDFSILGSDLIKEVIVH